MEPSNWASAHCDALRDYFLKGMSYAEIGREINVRFGTSYTRNAVIGRAKRMGLALPERVKSPPIVPPLPNGPRAVLPRRSAPPKPGQPPKSALKRAEPVKLRCVGIRPRLISMLELAQVTAATPMAATRMGRRSPSAAIPGVLARAIAPRIST
jgi:GcrA cell cycle regulator